MISINEVRIMGNLTRDPELKYTKSNTAYAKIGVAVNRSWKDKNDEWQEHVEFFNVTLWGKTAERVNQMQKGDIIFLNGRLSTNKWETDSGEKRSNLEITATDFRGFPKQVKKADYDPDANTGESTADETQEEEDPTDIPF